MEAQKKKPGRPKKTSLTKKFGVEIPQELFNSKAFSERLKYLSFNKYVNLLIDNDLK